MTIERIVLIIIDQLRADYIKYLPRCARFLPYHAVCDTGSIPASTEAMHANISTGTYPREHGFISKETKTGTDGLKQLEDLFDTGNISSISSTATIHGFETYIIGGKPETVLTMGREEECALRIHYDKNEQSFLTVGTKKAFFDNILRISETEQYKYVEPERLDERVLRIAEETIPEVERQKSLLIITLPSLDTLGHIYGPNSKEIINHLAFLDRAIPDVINTADGSKILILTGDHGCRTTTRYVIETDDNYPQHALVYVWDGSRYKVLEEHHLDADDNLEKIRYDGGILRLWFDKTHALLDSSDSEFLSRYGSIYSLNQKGQSTLIDAYQRSKHPNIGDITVVADSDVTFCKRGWIKKKAVLDRIAKRAFLDKYDLPIGEHGTYHLEDREVGFMSNYQMVATRLLNAEIRALVEKILVLSGGK